MSLLPAVEAELVVHPTFTFLGGNPAGGVGVGAGSEGWGGRGGLVLLVLRRPGRRGRRRRRRGVGGARSELGLLGTTGSVGLTLATLIAAELILAFPVAVVDLESAGFQLSKGGDGGGFQISEVFPEAAGETPVKAGPKGFLVPGGLGSQVLESGEVAVDVVGFLHLKEGKTFLDHASVLRVSETAPEVIPEEGSGSLEIRSGLL